MSENIDAVATATEIKATYRRYLQSLLAVRDSKINAALQAAIDDTPMLDKGPYLEATPPYAPGADVRSLIEDGVLDPGFAQLGSPAMPLDRALYVHQETAIRKVRAGRNVVVATGTGSGKTESFLIPILDSLVRESSTGTLGSGVRALLLYPMNALANDQMKRLRQLLAGYPAITFGRYTGDTQNDPKKARDLFTDLNPGEPMLPNELLSREEIRANPPHLLLTNYAMLEYLLLRPLDLGLFPAADDATWRFIVVDEAHVYDGTQGAEVAMLIRRLRDRVAPERMIQCIATSATVGGDAKPEAVAEFATRLFGMPFEWSSTDPSRQDLITATRVEAPPGPFWGPLTAGDYSDLVRRTDKDEAVREAGRRYGFDAPDGATALAHESRLAVTRGALSAGPLAFRTLASHVFPEDTAADGARGLAAMVELASGLRSQLDGNTPLAARYHLFLRATEGAFTCLSESGPHVHLARHTTCGDCASPVFEIGSCKRCGAVHLLGTIETDEGTPRLKPRKPDASAVWLVLGDQEGQIDEDEEAVVDDLEGVDGDMAKLCTACGALNAPEADACRAKGCGSSALRAVRRLKQKGLDVAGCVVCGARGAATVRVFETGADAAGAVITTSLYQNLPAGTEARNHDRPGEGRKLLMFSDSRQAAAYFAPYLEDSYTRLRRRRLITQGLQGAAADLDPVGIDDVVFQTQREAKKVTTFQRGLTAQQERREVAPWVMAEVLSTDDRQSLEGLGLVRITLDRDPSWPAPTPLKALGLSNDECWDFLEELVRTLRQQGAVTMYGEVAPNDDVFAPRLGPIYSRLSGPEAVRKVLSWLPGRGTNRRIDYTKRLLEELGSNEAPADVLEGVWKFLTQARVTDWLAATTPPRLGTVYQVDEKFLRLSLVTGDTPVFRCQVCRRTTPVSVRSVCPALSCSGTLETFFPAPLADERDHYRAVYQSMHAVPLVATEHTAQWKNTEAARIQQDFIRGTINALSCSTTFELGVDVGELQAVMLRNMPPTTANYVQRAGRAGRRSGAAALVVTYAQRRSHDLTRYAAPETMMAGEVRAPYVTLDNERIDRRHAHSVAMAAFFRWWFELTGGIARKAGDFFLAQLDGSEPPVAAVQAFLDPVPSDLLDSLTRILPAAVHREVGIDDGSWVEVLVGLLGQVTAELTQDVATLEGLRDEAASAQKFQLAAKYQMVTKTLRDRDLLGFLATHNVIPKYGFPVDSVELRTNFSVDEHTVGTKLDLSRDLSQAIYEYAPDATLVAGGKLWTSRGVYRLPGKDLEEFAYQVCKRCGGYRDSVVDLDPSCPTCGELAIGAARRLVIPEFGFVAARQTARPGARPPRRSWSGATYVLKMSDEARERAVSFPGGRIEVEVGPRGRLIAVADGAGSAGFWLCDWCGWGGSGLQTPPRQHEHLFKNDKCSGPVRRVSLAHRYETDLLRLDVHVEPGCERWAVEVGALRGSRSRLGDARDCAGRYRRHPIANRRNILVPGAVRRRPRWGRQRHPDRTAPRGSAHRGTEARGELRMWTRNVLLRLPTRVRQPAGSRRTRARGGRATAQLAA